MSDLRTVYDDHAEFYAERMGDGCETGQTGPAIIDFLGDVEGSDILDLACGEGYFTRWLARHGARATGVDASSRLLARARQRAGDLPIAFHHEDAQRLACLDDESFDAVLCSMAMMDIPDLAPTLVSVHRVLRPGGRFVFGILHPCFCSPFNARNPPDETDADGNVRAMRVTRYGTEGRWYSDGRGMLGHFGSYHRRLETYVNGLIEAGFTIQQMREPLAPQVDDGPRRLLGAEIPHFLVIGSTKG